MPANLLSGNYQKKCIKELGLSYTTYSTVSDILCLSNVIFPIYVYFQMESCIYLNNIQDELF